MVADGWLQQIVGFVKLIFLKLKDPLMHIPPDAK